MSGVLSYSALWHTFGPRIEEYLSYERHGFEIVDTIQVGWSLLTLIDDLRALGSAFFRRSSTTSGRRSCWSWSSPPAICWIRHCC